MTALELTELTEQLIERLQADLERCTTREDHIRVTARASEAVAILNGLHLMVAHQTHDES
jgi:hypothetical protein